LGWKGEGPGPHVLHSTPPVLKLTPSHNTVHLTILIA
jgi:hypothetical protein